MDPVTGAVIGSAIAAAASIVVALITRPARKTVRQMDAVHTAVTVNGHSNADKPTVLDLIAELRDEVRVEAAHNADFRAWSREENSRLWRAIRSR